MAGRPGERYPCPPAAISAVALGLGALWLLGRCLDLGRVVVEGRSMAPALAPGDRLVVRRRRRYRPGAVVAVRDPRAPERVLVKRVVAVVGGRLEVRGDDPAASTDSRAFGTVPAALVRGQAVWRYHPPGRTGRVPGARRGRRYPGPVDTAALDRLLAPSFPGDVGALTMDELRARRAECQELEVVLSYQRRMAQGRLDIVAAERARRAAGAEPIDHEHLVEQLSGILADRTHAPGPGRLPTVWAPGPEGLETPELDALAPPHVLDGLPDQDDAEIGRLVEALSAHEAELSEQRRALHERIDLLQGEITRRYRTGEASVESLLK